MSEEVERWLEACRQQIVEYMIKEGYGPLLELFEIKLKLRDKTK